MTERIDHTADAVRVLENGDRLGARDVVAYAAAAQVHATLEVAKQLRIRNEIEYVRLVDETMRLSNAHPNEFDQTTRDASIKRRNQTVGMIREGLGLS